MESPRFGCTFYQPLTRLRCLGLSFGDALESLRVSVVAHVGFGTVRDICIAQFFSVHSYQKSFYAWHVAAAVM